MAKIATGVKMKTLGERLFLSGYLYSINFIHYDSGNIWSCAIEAEHIDEPTRLKDIIEFGECHFYYGLPTDYENSTIGDCDKEPMMAILNGEPINLSRPVVISVDYNEEISSLDIGYTFSEEYNDSFTNKDFKTLLSTILELRRNSNKFISKSIANGKSKDFYDHIYNQDNGLIHLSGVSIDIPEDLHPNFGFFEGNSPAASDTIRKAVADSEEIIRRSMAEQMAEQVISKSSNFNKVLKEYTASELWTNIARNHRHTIKRRAL
jgi:hypothetical protein